MKRALDIVLSGTGLLLLAAPLGIIALAVFLEDRRSPFYRGLRTGRGGRAFHMLKFRSMRVDAWKSGVNSTAAGDPRLTRTGGVLRRFKLDELPQLINVFMGQMSFTGPRPQVLAEVRLYTGEEQKLLGVRPGITDLASIVFADESEILAGSPDPDLLYNQIIRPWKSRLALASLDHASLALDARIVAWTLLSAISRRRALDRLVRILESWQVDPALIRAARRESRLEAFPPPGSTEIVSVYSQSATHA